MSDDEIKQTGHQVLKLSDGGWIAYMHGVLVTDTHGMMITFDTEEDAWTFLEEADERNSSVDS